MEYCSAHGASEQTCDHRFPALIQQRIGFINLRRYFRLGWVLSSTDTGLSWQMYGSNDMLLEGLGALSHMPCKYRSGIALLL